MSNLDFTRLRELVDYDPTTGVFTRKVSSRGVKAGSNLGHVHRATKYVQVGFDRRVYYAHRLAWFYTYGVWPEGSIDHINGDRADNRLENLRDVTHSQNMLNKHTILAKSGFMGVVAHKNRWRADVTVDGVQHYLGLFNTPEEAHDAYITRKQKLLNQAI